MSNCEKHEFFGECESYCPWCCIAELEAVLDRLGDERWLTIPKKKGVEPENIHINKWFHMNINKWLHEWDTRIEYARTRGGRR